MRRSVVGWLLVAACSPLEAPSTTTGAAATSMARTTTTSRGVESTATSATTTSAPTTSTTSAAALPFVVSQAGLIGYFDGEHWVTASLDAPVAGGELYEVVDLGGTVGQSVGGELTTCEPAGTPLVDLDPPLLNTHSEPGELAIAGAAWDLQPRPTKASAEVPADLLAEAVAFVSSRGLSDPTPAVAQYLLVDLEGDGVPEELLVTNRMPPDLIGTAESYSLVLMRKQLDVEPAILVVAYSQGVADNPFVVSSYVTAVVDLNGDGQMEIVLDGHYYEGDQTSVFEYANDDLGLIEVIASGCGA